MSRALNGNRSDPYSQLTVPRIGLGRLVRPGGDRRSRICSRVSGRSGSYRALPTESERWRGRSRRASCTAIASTRRESTSVSAPVASPVSRTQNVSAADPGRHVGVADGLEQHVGGVARQPSASRGRRRAAPRSPSRRTNTKTTGSWRGRPSAGGARRSARTRGGSAARSPRPGWRARDAAGGCATAYRMARGRMPGGIEPRPDDRPRPRAWRRCRRRRSPGR